MNRDLTDGNITKTMLLFALPMIAGNLLQQFYNIADTLIVGRFIGPNALAAVGSAYSLMTFLTSIIIGLCMGSGALFSIFFGRKDMDKLKNSIFVSFIIITATTLVLNIAVFILIDNILVFLRVPAEVYSIMRDYIFVIFIGLGASFLYNFFASLLRSIGNSVVPLLFLAVSAVMNIVLDLVFVITFDWGVSGAAAATVISQFVSGIGIFIYTLIKFPECKVSKKHMNIKLSMVAELSQFSFLTCVQQSVMNFGILMIQGLVNSFGTTIMAAFAAAVKIDSFAYMPVQDFGNAFSTFTAQNYGAGKPERIRKGIRSAVIATLIFCTVISLIVFLSADKLMLIFIKPEEKEIISAGAHYLRIEGACYIGIGILFLFYGFYRAVKIPSMSVVLTVISLGTRVALAYLLSPVKFIGVTGIWAAIPVGWLLADITGFIYYRAKKDKIEKSIY
ncbi:MATE family efflux transporter [Lachnospiraceae bacterium NSJ-143]|nr:MATE family efflux transporter [Lachnospiraceae bacterium NSJ-143]